MAKAINDAIAALEYKSADYTAVEKAIEVASKLDKALYKDFSKVDAALAAVVKDKNITEQAAVDAMAKAINNAVAALEKVNPDTSDRTVGITLFLVAASVLLISAIAIKKNRRYSD